MTKCTQCPRMCGVDRSSALGFCRSGLEAEVGGICVHGGEEPPIAGERGVCNVFFNGCSLKCVYCQNRPLWDGTASGRRMTIDALVDRIAETLATTENVVGFVTPTHYTHLLPRIVDGLHRRGLHPTTVYNCGGYERVETLQELEGMVDVYLPDFKYADSRLAARYSGAADYPQVALDALKEMYRQKGSPLITDERGMAVSGIVVRHLVLPGCVENSCGVLDRVAEVSMNLHVSLMAQYYPPREGMPDALGRTVTAEEYEAVLRHWETTGLHNGWQQELSAERSYRPEFNVEKGLAFNK